MKKRDIIQEIASVKSRSEFNSRHDYSGRLSDIEYALKEFGEYNGNFNQELLKYIPISTVACFEAFFKSTIKELIDFGKPFSDNVAAFNQSKNVKLDFEVVAAIQTKTLTVGEFVAHLLPYNNLEDLSANLTTLIGKDFLTELRNFNRKSIFEGPNIVHATFQRNTADILASVKKTYELRHIFCHEFATNLRVDQASILKNFENCKVFLEHSNYFIWDLLYPNSAETQTEMNGQAYDEFEKHDQSLTQLVSRIKSAAVHDGAIESFDEALFDEAMRQWKKYRRLHAECRASSVKGGTMYPMLVSSRLTYVTKEKIKSLEDEFEVLLRRVNPLNNSSADNE